MFHEMRLHGRQLSPEDAERILRGGEYGILSTFGPDGFPYGTPLNYVYAEQTIYFHCALSGHKLENAAHCANVCFTVVGKTQVAPEQFSTRYESAVAFGKIYEAAGAEKRSALEALIKKYSPGYQKEGRAYIDEYWDRVAVYAIRIGYLTGKGH